MSERVTGWSGVCPLVAGFRSVDDTRAGALGDRVGVHAEEGGSGGQVKRCHVGIFGGFPVPPLRSHLRTRSR